MQKSNARTHVAATRAMLIALAVLLLGVALCVMPRAAYADDAQEVTWTPDDFTYSDYSYKFYGCDYSRQFTLSGTVVAGFSGTGEEKLASGVAGCTDIVIPARTPDGEAIVGVGQKAFYERGLTSVTFPTGMFAPYDDTVTHRITKRGNFVVAEDAFAKNKLKDVYLPDGVLAVMSNAFQMNELESVTLPQTIWWIETQSFAKNKISRVNFPATTDFQLEMHGMAFANNEITSVRLPDFTEVVNMYTFMYNPGMEPLPEGTPDKLKAEYNGKSSGVVYMYADNVDLSYKERIHHLDRTTASTKSYVQKLIVADGTAVTANPDPDRWTVDDFTFAGENGATVTGLSESGIAKRAANRNLVIPSYTADGWQVTALADTTATYGLFGAAGQGFDTVELPNHLKSIGANAFAQNGLKDVVWAPQLESVGMAAFRDNNLTSVVLPDTITALGEGTFATNPLLERVEIPTGITEIPAGAFGCSDAKHWMTGFTQVDIPEGITKIGRNAFAGNNFERIEIPGSVVEIGDMAFSTKNYLKTPCTLKLNEGLRTIGKFAFRNKIIQAVQLPTTVEALPENAFLKAYSASIEDTVPLITRVFVSSANQLGDAENFPSPCEDSHEIVDATQDGWTAEDFTYGTLDTSGLDLQLADKSSDKLVAQFHVVTGLSDSGKERIQWSHELSIPYADPDGQPIRGVGDSAFKGMGITKVTFPEGAFAENDKPAWNDMLEQRGDFIIGASAFYGNALSRVDLPEGVLAVMGNAFGNNAITRATLPSTLFYVGNQAFAKNAIVQVDFPTRTDFPLQVARLSFAQNQLTAAQVPENLDYLDKWAFFQNPGVEAVPDSATANEKAGGVVYLYARSLSGLGGHIESLENGKSNVQRVLEGAMPKDDAWTADDFTYEGGAITGWSDTGMVKRLTNHALVLPDKTPGGQQVESIGAGAFRSPDAEVNLDEAKYDYQAAYGIETVKLPAGLKSIGDEAFMYNSLAAVPFADAPGLASIGAMAFKGNHIRKLQIPDTVTEMGEGTFAANGLVSLKLSHAVTEIPAGAFSMNIRLAHVDIPDTVVRIGDTAFAGARIESLEIPASVEYIGRKAFHLHRMESLTIPGTVKEIADNAFEGTYKGQTLKTLVLEEGIERIGTGAFKEGLLVEVALPSSLKELGSEPFENNTGDGTSKHVVKLTTENEAHLAFNEGAKTHQVVLAGAEEEQPGTDEPGGKGDGKGDVEPTPATPEKADDAEPAPASIAKAKVTVAKATYTGKALKPAVKVVLGKKTLVAGTDYSVSYANAKGKAVKASNLKAAGTYTVTVKGKGAYTGKAQGTLTVAKAKQPLKAKAKKAKVALKASQLKKKAQTVANVKVVAKAKGKVACKNASSGAAKKFKVTSKGAVKVLKGTKAGTYKLKVKMTAKGDANHKAGSATVSFKVVVK